MAIAFPTNPQPVVDDQYVQSDPPQDTDNQYTFQGTEYRYESLNNRWLAQQSGGASVTVSQIPPANASDGDLWWYCGADDEDPSLFTYVDDATGVGSWIQSSPGIAFDGSSGTTSAADQDVMNNNYQRGSYTATVSSGAGGGQLTTITYVMTPNVYQGEGMYASEEIVTNLEVGDYVTTNVIGNGNVGRTTYGATMFLNGVSAGTASDTYDSRSQSRGVTSLGTVNFFVTQEMVDGRSGQDAITFTALGNGEGTIGVGGLLFADSLLP